MEYLRKKAYFDLYPFQDEEFTTGLDISGTVACNQTNLQISYELRGNIEEVLLPCLATTSNRRDWLWQATCFEAFVALRGSPRYWEVNLSPAGDWNCYAFTDYRHGMREETSITALSFIQQRLPKLFRLALDFPLRQLVAPAHSIEAIEVAVSVIIQGYNGQRAFYALAHCGSQPDFHRRESFLVRM